MPLEPLIFVEVALVEELASDVQRLLDIEAPLSDPAKASTAIFYSISATQNGLRGVSFGNFLLKRVIDDLQRDFPKLGIFATLSPLPGLVRWANANPESVAAAIGEAGWSRLAAAGVEGPSSSHVRTLFEGGGAWAADAALAAALREPLLRVAAAYLTQASRNRLPVDPVARFHLGNGARVERLNWLADTSPRGLAQSWGIMVNYLYDPARLEANLEAYAREGRIDASPAVRRLVRR
jgi:malonyl-CoA decarboxylase